MKFTFNTLPPKLLKMIICICALSLNYFAIAQEEFAFTETKKSATTILNDDENTVDLKVYKNINYEDERFKFNWFQVKFAMSADGKYIIVSDRSLEKRFYIEKGITFYKMLEGVEVYLYVKNNDNGIEEGLRRGFRLKDSRSPYEGLQDFVDQLTNYIVSGRSIKTYTLTILRTTTLTTINEDSFSKHIPKYSVIGAETQLGGSELEVELRFKKLYDEKEFLIDYLFLLLKKQGPGKGSNLEIMETQLKLDIKLLEIKFAHSNY